MVIVVVNRDAVSTALASYFAAAPDRRLDAVPLLSALCQEDDVVSRSTFPLHVTCSAAVVDAVGDVLMVRHRWLGAWRLPGGHVEPHDQSMYEAALRELEAETGTCWHHTASAEPDEVVPVDVHIHSVPADGTRNEPSHVHADFRYAFSAGGFEMFTSVKKGTAFAWRPPLDLPAPRFTFSAYGIWANGSIPY
ncbi:NUDIX hydrolase [Nonomuraea sp. NPDC049480]|uniref:NUDIX hydrolase n=1 Tax=Nonomuraea sp. NPDC049480 TaxID=3364353 RepID=UPI00378BD82E